MTPVLISSTGDMFLSDKIGKIYWLDVGNGTINQVTESFDNFHLLEIEAHSSFTGQFHSQIKDLPDGTKSI